MRALAPALCLSCACAPEPADPPAHSGGQVVYEHRFEQSSRLTLLVVDDAATEDAADQRGAVLEALRAGLHQLVLEQWDGYADRDPAVDHPLDERVLIVLPSAPDAASMIGPHAMPNLAWVTHMVQDEQVEPLVQAAELAMAPRFASTGELHRTLRAAQRAVELVLGLRAPADQAEQALASSLAPDAYVRVLIAGTRDDQGKEPVTAQAPHTVRHRVGQPAVVSAVSVT